MLAPLTKGAVNRRQRAGGGEAQRKNKNDPWDAAGPSRRPPRGEVVGTRSSTHSTPPDSPTLPLETRSTPISFHTGLHPNSRTHHTTQHPPGPWMVFGHGI